MYSIGIDTGGTFTDVMVIDPQGQVSIHKVPSTPTDPSQAIIQALRETGVPLDRIGRLVHGTTVNTNAMLTGRGARAALLTTRGFRDVLEIRRAHRLADYANLYNLQQELPQPLVPRRWRREVNERVLWDGTVLRELPEGQIRTIAEELKQEGVEAIAIAFIFSYNHPEHELRTKQIVQEVLPDAFVTTSVETDAVFREYERTSTTVVNAYLGPHSGRYLTTLGERLRESGFRGEVQIMASNGGTFTIPAAVEKPVYTVLSGLAAGAIGGSLLSEMTGLPNLITFDMGGTSTDVCLIKDGEATLTTEGEIAHHALTIPTINVHTIGAGGGSVAWIDVGGALRVGPQSVGADPGPSCYGWGGDQAAVADANLALGYLNPDNFLGGRMSLQTEKARNAIARWVMEPLSLPSVVDAAYAVYMTVNANMAAAMRVVSVDRGYDPRDFYLAAFGGAGPLHAVALAEALDMKGVVVPLYPGIHSATGLLSADIQHDFRRSYLAPTGTADLAMVEEIYTQLEAEGRAQLEREGLALSDQHLQRLAEIRYIGQAHEVSVEMPSGSITTEVVAALKARFHQLHREMFAHASEGAPTMFVTLAVRAVGRTTKPEFTPIDEGGAEPPAPASCRQAYFATQGRMESTPVWKRSQLKAGNQIVGPAIIEQMDTTTVVPPGYRVQVDRLGTLIITRA